jgi:hypothetical protein
MHTNKYKHTHSDQARTDAKKKNAFKDVACKQLLQTYIQTNRPPPKKQQTGIS